MSNENPLKNIVGKVNKKIGNAKTPFQKHKEGTTSVQVRNSTYEKLRLRAFKEHKSVVDLTDKAVKYALKNNII